VGGEYPKSLLNNGTPTASGISPGLISFLPLQTTRLTIREFQLVDSPQLFRLHRDFRATRYAGGTRTQEQSFQSLCRIIKKTRDTGFGTLAVQLRATGEVLGWIGVQQIVGRTSFELLYALKPTAWGSGFATEASTNLVELVFQLPKPRISALFGIVYPQNLASIRVLEKLGMRLQGYYMDEPTQRHACLYCLTKREFTRNEYCESSAR
jgi:RimJ/RimL family protein N-acetyltransferase